VEFTINVNIKVPDEIVSVLQDLASALLVNGTTHAAAAVAAVSGQATEQHTTPAQEDRPKRQQRTQKRDEPEQRVESDEPQKVEVPTVVELRAKAQSAGATADAKKAIKALLDKFGSKSISDIPEERRADFLAELDSV